MTPRLSVCMTVRDSAEVIRQALDSVRHPEVEIVATDHGSTDGTRDILREYTHKVRPVPVTFRYDYGEDALKNLAFDDAEGDWLMVLDSDEAVSDVATLLAALDYVEAVYPEADVLRLDHWAVLDETNPFWAGRRAPAAETYRVPSPERFAQYKCYLDYNLHARIFKRRSGVRFSGWIHVNLYHPDGRSAEPGLFVGPFYVHGPVLIYHLNDFRTPYHLWRHWIDDLTMRLKVIEEPGLMRGAGAAWFNPAEAEGLREAIRRFEASPERLPDLSGLKVYGL